MKRLFQPAVIAIFVVAGFASCKKEGIQPIEQSSASASMETGRPNFELARLLVKKDSDSLVYNAGGTLTKVIYSPTKYVSYLKSGNTLTATTFENNVMKLQVKYTLVNGRATESKHTSWESNVGVTKTWLYDYDVDGYLMEKYNKNNHAERYKYYWIGADNLWKINIFNGNDVHISTMLFIRAGSYGPADKLKLNSKRSGLDPYLKIFGKQPSILSQGENMTYHQSPASNFVEDHNYTFDRNGYPTKLEIVDQATSTIIKTENFKYNN